MLNLQLLFIQTLKDSSRWNLHPSQNPRSQQLQVQFTLKSQEIFIMSNQLLVGGWTNPSEKYAQVKLDSSSPRFGVKIPKIFELPPPRLMLNTYLYYHIGIIGTFCFRKWIGDKSATLWLKVVYPFRQLKQSVFCFVALLSSFCPEWQWSTPSHPRLTGHPLASESLSQNNRPMIFPSVPLGVLQSHNAECKVQQKHTYFNFVIMYI